MERGLVRLKIFITGGSSGVGQSCAQLLGEHHDVTAPARAEFDLSDFNAIDRLDLSSYDIVINCAGANAGAYLGWHNNSWSNQVDQINVNFTAGLLLAKQYTQQRKQGQFIYISSTNIEDPIAYNIFYTAAKAALKYSLDCIKQEFPMIVFTEICPGKIRSNMLQQNYQGTKTPEEIKAMYAKGTNLSPIDIAIQVQHAIKYKLNQITIVPHENT